MNDILSTALILHQAGKLPDAQTLYDQILARDPSHAQAHDLRGLVAFQTGNHALALVHVSTAVNLTPQVANYHDHLGQILSALGRLPEAIAAYQQAIELDSQHAIAHNNLGLAQYSAGRPAEAAACFHRAAQADPQFAEAYNNLGMTLVMLGQFEAASAACQRAIELRADFAAAHNNLGNAMFQQGRLAEAEACYRQAAALDPNYLEARWNLAGLLQQQGRFEESQQQYQNVLHISPENTAAPYGLSLLKQHTSADDEEIARLELQVAQPSLSAAARRPLHFALGKILDDCGRYDEAFGHFQQANALDRPEFDRAAFEQYVTRLLDAFPAELHARRAKSSFSLDDPKLDLPIWIVGMPRSGTSLVEQILATHPQVYGGGELADWNKIVADLPSRLDPATPYPECVKQLDDQFLSDIAADYLQHLRRLAPEAERVTDKMPTNFMHLGLIALAFPHGRVIRCRRDPRDTCLSCYFQAFPTRPPFCNDLGDLAFYYGQYERVMAHWRRVLPFAMLDVQYEDLVQDQEQVSQQMVEFCGLDWDSRCLEFHKNPRTVQTSSSWQVRQPMYSRSIGRWKNYAKWLDADWLTPSES
jgi:tetratricopeptide (TPR) repeat protein